MPTTNDAIDEAPSHRIEPVSTASAEDLVEHLEAISGRPFYTRQDINAWLAEVRDRAAREVKAGKSRKRLLLLIGVLAAFLQYQIIDMMIEVGSLRSAGIAAPASRVASYRS